MFLLNLHGQICRNALLDQRNLVKIIKNGTRLALKLVWSIKNWTFQWKLVSYVFSHFGFVPYLQLFCSWLFEIVSCFVDPIIFASLQIKSYYFKKQCNYRQQLFFIIVNKMWWRLLVMSFHTIFGTYIKSLLMFCL
jgi:hypothetical protein